MPNFCSFYHLTLLGLCASSLKAEDHPPPPVINLDPILITGTKPSADYPINAPLNFTAFDQEIIKQLGFTRIQDIAPYVPNYNLMDAGANGFSDRSSIRGLANTPIFTTPSVVLYVDDIPYLTSSAYTNQLELIGELIAN